LLLKEGYKTVIVFGLDFSFRTDLFDRGSYIEDYNQHYVLGDKDIYEGIRWRFPDVDRKVKSMEDVRRAIEKRGKSIVNATLFSCTNVFPQDLVTFRDYYNEDAYALQVACTGMQGFFRENVLHNIDQTARRGLMRDTFVISENVSMFEEVKSKHSYLIEYPEASNVENPYDRDVIKHGLLEIEKKTDKIVWFLLCSFGNRAATSREFIEKALKYLMIHTDIDSVVSAVKKPDDDCELILKDEAGTEYVFDGQLILCRRSVFMGDDSSVYPWLTNARPLSVI
jgi:hypothetical protein